MFYKEILWVGRAVRWRRDEKARRGMNNTRGMSNMRGISDVRGVSDISGMSDVRGMSYIEEMKGVRGMSNMREMRKTRDVRDMRWISIDSCKRTKKREQIEEVTHQYHREAIGTLRNQTDTLDPVETFNCFPKQHVNDPKRGGTDRNAKNASPDRYLLDHMAPMSDPFLRTGPGVDDGQDIRYEEDEREPQGNDNEDVDDHSRLMYR